MLGIGQYATATKNRLARRFVAMAISAAKEKPRTWGFMVPGTGIEPVRQFDPPTDFKSVVSTYFTTRAAGKL